jgi:hypothetical protein
VSDDGAKTQLRSLLVRSRDTTPAVSGNSRSESLMGQHVSSTTARNPACSFLVMAPPLVTAPALPPNPDFVAAVCITRPDDHLTVVARWQ